MNILITGAAKGIGAAIATLAVKKGHTVGIYDVDITGAANLAAVLNNTKHRKRGQAIAGTLNVTDGQAWDNALAEFIAFAGGIDVLVNNAGLLCSGKFETIDLQKHLAQVEVNTKGVLLGCYKVKPFLAKHANAKVVNLSSGSAIYGQPDVASYSASKFFVRGLTEGLDTEWAADGIRCIDIMPLFVQTAMVQGMQAGSIEKFGVTQTPQDVAKTVLSVINKPNCKWQNTHQPVGLKTKVMHRLAQLAPARVNFIVHKNMAR